MADFSIYFPKLLRYEGGYMGNTDGAICTNLGVTLATWQQFGHDLNGDGVIDCADIHLLTPALVSPLYKKEYWDKWQADQINNQSIAELLVDWTVNSGSHGITIPQGVLGVAQDGQVGQHTLSAINDNPDQQGLFNQLWETHKDFYERLAQNNPNDEKFLNGWLSRLDQQIFQA